MQLDERACLFLDDPFGLGSAAVTCDSKLDDGCCTISFGYRLSATVTKLSCPGTALTACPAHTG